MNYASHLTTASQLLAGYQAEMPFHIYLKKYFKQNKKHGSRDRKLITAFCYNYFRLGFALKESSVEERILAGMFLCGHEQADVLKFYKPAWKEAMSKTLEEKSAILNNSQLQFIIKDIFPFTDELSNEIDPEKFNLSFLIQPKLFIRIRHGFKDIVLKKLQTSAQQYEVIFEDCIALANSSKVDKILKLDEEAVVQDYNSQRTGDLIRSKTENLKQIIAVWDCCAASGGKSIMAYDINPKIQLTVSDKRKTILENLQHRFTRAGIRNYHSFVADLSTRDQQIPNEKFDLIIADVPCTGSGTWARTPEQLFYFDKKQIEKYSVLQKQIVQNIIPYLKPGGYLLYITCSVFKKENENIIRYLKEAFNMKVEQMQALKGYELFADTMFVSLLSVPNNG